MKLDPAKRDWLSDQDNLAVIEALGRDQARFVGGCIRNSLLGAPVADIDIATTLEPDAVIAALKAAKIRHVPTGLAYGTITAVRSGRPIEITTLRRDVSTDGRRATVAYTNDWAQDAQRRDLTINALYCDADGQVYDPTGQGLADLEARKFRFVGDAAVRVQEDYLRILRYFRFFAWYGADAKMDKAALQACRENRKGMTGLSAERVWSEIKRILSAPNPSRALHIMLSNEILEQLLPEASNVEGLDLLIKLEQREAIKPDPLLRLMAMSARNPLPMALLTRRLKMSNAEKARLRGWADDITPFDPMAPERDKRAAIYKTGKQLAMDRCRIRAAGEPDVLMSARWMSLVDLAMGWTPPQFPLTGKDLIAAGVKKGPAMGKRMDALKALWIRSGFTADKTRLLAALKLMGG